MGGFWTLENQKILSSYLVLIIAFWPFATPGTSQTLFRVNVVDENWALVIQN